MSEEWWILVKEEVGWRKVKGFFWWCIWCDYVWMDLMVGFMFVESNRSIVNIDIILDELVCLGIYEFVIIVILNFNISFFCYF